MSQLTPELRAGLDAVAAEGKIAMLVLNSDGKLLASVSPPKPIAAVLLLPVAEPYVRTARPD